MYKFSLPLTLLVFITAIGCKDGKITPQISKNTEIECIAECRNNSKSSWCIGEVHHTHNSSLGSCECLITNCIKTPKSKVSNSENISQPKVFNDNTELQEYDANTLEIEPETEDINCSDPQGSAEVKECSYVKYEEANTTLNKVLQLILRNLSDHAKEYLLSEQKEWSKLRDIRCDEATSGLNFAFTDTILMHNECLEMITKDRVIFLQEVLTDLEG